MSGLNKSREELPWLYYPRSNSVRVINSHLDGGGGGGSIAVNGKSPIAAWIPSLDTSGNGTTTLTDLTGNGNTGTLTDMDPSTDWVADTDAGGIRALDLDGVNDWVALSGSLAFTTAISFSGWIKLSAYNTDQRWLERDVISGADDFSFAFNGTTGRTSARIDGQVGLVGAGNALSLNTWHHVVVVGSGTNITVWQNGASVLSATVTAIDMTSGSGTTRIGKSHLASNYLAGRVDDMRLFDVALDSTDVAYLYNGGNGRGRTS